MIVYEREFRWDEDFITFDRYMLAAMYGQHCLGDRGEKQIIFELDVVDDRFSGDYDLPYDGSAEVVEDKLLKINGWTRESGGMPLKSVVLPADVMVKLSVWTQED